MSHRAVATSIVALCLASFVSTIIGSALFGGYQVDLGAPLVLLLGLPVAKGSTLAIKLAVLVMALYTLVAVLMIACALVAPSRLSAPPTLMSTPSGLLLIITSCIVGGAWAGLNAVALVRLLGRPVLAA